MFLALKSKLLDTDVFHDCEFLDSYVDLILKNQHTVSVKSSTQVHHIIPRSYYELRKQPVDNSPANLVTLLYKDHILAHYYLALCSKNTFRYAMENAFMMLTNFSSLEDKEFVKNLDKYQQLYENTCESRRGIAPANKGRPMPEEQKRKISNSLKGHNVSAETRERQRQAQLNMSPEARARNLAGIRARNYVPSNETRKKQSESLMGHVVTEETRAKIGLGNKKQTGNRWYNNGVECVLVRAGESPPEGYVYGTLRKRHWITDGVVNKSIKCNEPVPGGFRIGRTR